MTNSPETKPILVIGSTGKTGGRVAERLERLGPSVRHGSRSAAIPFDWAAPHTWAPALAGVTSVYLTYSPDLAAPGSCEAVTELVALAKAAGVSRIVLLSGRGEQEAERAEDVVKASGLEWTVVRAAWFNQNFSEGSFAADVAVAALTDERHVSELYEVTGPRLLTFADAVATLAREMGRDLRFISVPMFHYADTLAQYQVP